MKEYENEEELDAEIESMLNPSPEEDTEGAVSTESPVETETQTTDETIETVEKSRYDNAVRKMHEATSEAADLRRQLNEAVSRIEALEKPAQPSVEDDDELSTVMNDYPEIVGPILKQNKMLMAKIAELERSLGTVQQTTDRVAKTEQERANDAYRNKILAEHPDFLEQIHSDEISEWGKSQAPFIQYIMANGTTSPDDVIFILDKFKKDTGKVQNVSTNKLDEAKKAATPNVAKSQAKPDSKKTFTRADIAKMSIEDFAKYEDLIDEQLSQGLIS